MKKLFRAAYGDESRVMFIVADNLDEAIKLANEREIGFTDEYEIRNEFEFDEESVFEIDLNIQSQVIDDIHFHSAF